MRITSIPNQHRLLAHTVTALAARGTRVDRVAVVEALADGVALGYLEAHWTLEAEKQGSGCEVCCLGSGLEGVCCV